MGLGDINREMGNYEESEKMFKKALEINPDSESYRGLGWLYFNQGKYDLAEKAFKQFLERIREKGEIYFALGQVYIEEGRMDDAKKALKRAVELTPENKEFQRSLQSIIKFNLGLHCSPFYTLDPDYCAPQQAS